MLRETSGSAFHATVEAASGRVPYPLIVEELQDGTWDWASGNQVADLSWDGTISLVPFRRRSRRWKLRRCR
jgi:hypothetical protein